MSYEQSRLNEAGLQEALERERAARSRLDARFADAKRGMTQLHEMAARVGGGNELHTQSMAVLQGALLDLLEQEDEGDESLPDEPGSDEPGSDEEDGEVLPPAEVEPIDAPTHIMFEAAAAVDGVAGRVVLGSDRLIYRSLVYRSEVHRWEVYGSVTPLPSSLHRLKLVRIGHDISREHLDKTVHIDGHVTKKISPAASRRSFFLKIWDFTSQPRTAILIGSTTHRRPVHPVRAIGARAQAWQSGGG